MNSTSKSDHVPVIVVQNSTNKRMRHLEDQFNADFGHPPSYLVRVPGRVNIIGEHIDYCGYPVLPMALEQDILIACAPRNDSKLLLRNVNKKYNNYDNIIKTFKEIEIVSDENGKPYWFNYVLCGVKGGLEYLDDKMIHGLELYIDGNIPPASGLSSSSALVSASCLAFLQAQNAVPTKEEIASLCAKSERYIGTQGGGMDQAIAFLAQKYSAQYISFQPLHAAPVALPENAAFVVAQSLSELNKAATNDFNTRVAECRLAAQVIAFKAGLITKNEIITLSQLQKSLGKTLEQMIDLVHNCLPIDFYNKAAICSLLNLTQDEIDQLFLTANTRHIIEFKLKQRALHVFEEALRVEKFRNICENVVKNNNILQELGEIMFSSHESLKKLYECSHSNLDKLVDISKEFGVYARLTGAGWGGCVVAICHRDEVDKYIDLLCEEFYVKHCKLHKSDAYQYVFATTPNDGAVVYKYICN